MNVMERRLERLKSVLHTAKWQIGHTKKYFWQRRHLGGTHRTFPVWIFGAGRSGTTMFGELLEKAPEIWVYHEWHARAFKQWRLLDDERIQRLIKNSPASCVAFKPIVQSYIADRIMDRFDDSVGIWIYRSYDDVANSAVRKWDGSHRQSVEQIAAGDTDKLGWWEGRPPDHLESLQKAIRFPNLNDHEGAALYWYVQNQFYFTLDLHNDPRILLVNYEDLVTRPTDIGPRVFEHIGLPFDPSYAAQMHAGSINRQAVPNIRPDIHQLCAALYERLSNQLANSRG